MDAIKLIEIEISNYCNRKCLFCPNSKTVRNNKQNIDFLDWDSYSRLIKELKKNHYNGVFSFSRYNEPLATLEELKKYISLIRENMNNKIVTNTNGDFLTLEGICLFDELSIMDYDNKGELFWREKIKQIYPTASLELNENCLIGLVNKTKVLVFLDFQKNASIEDRGGIIEPIFKMKNNYEKRNRPCYEPLHFIGIDFTGDVMPCCNLRHDFHSNRILGNIKNKSINEILSSSSRVDFIFGAINNLPQECLYCQKDAGRYTREEPGIEYKGERK